MRKKSARALLLFPALLSLLWTAGCGVSAKPVVANATTNPGTDAQQNIAITAQPVNASVVTGQPAVFSVAAQGAGTLSYQWQMNGSAITGANATSYTISATTAAQNGEQFSVLVSNGTAAIASNAAILTVNSASSGPSASGPSTAAPSSASSGVPKCGLVADGSNKMPSDWATFQAPAEGGYYVDGTFGCQVTRLTNGVADFGSSPQHSVTVYYSTTDVFSADDAMLWVELDDGQNYIIQNPYLTGQNGIAVPIANMPGFSGTMAWDRSNANLFYYASGNALHSGTVTGRPSCLPTKNCTVATSVAHTFSEYASVGMMDETSESVDGCNVLMEGQATIGGTIDVFAWNMCSGTKSTPYTTTCTGTVTGNNNSCLHKMIIAGDNNLLIARGDVNEEVSWNGTTATCMQGCGSGTGTMHGDAGLDLAGNPVWVSGAGGPPFNGDVLANEQNPCPYTAWTSLVKTSSNSPLSAGTCLWDFSPSGLPSGGNGGGWHVGYRGSSNQPWITVSWFNLGCPWYFQSDSSYCAPTTSNWPTYGGEIQLVNIGTQQSSTTNANSGVYRLAYDRSRTEENFWAQVLATGSYDGKYIAFDSNMAYGVSGCTGNWDEAGDCSDVYIISAPGSFGTNGAPLF